MSRRRRRTLPPNIRETAYGIEVYTRSGGRYRSTHFPYTQTDITPGQLVDAYREDIDAWLRLYRHPRQKKDRPARGTLLADLPEYLKARAAMTSIAERERHLREWAALFPDRRWHTLTKIEIEQQRDRWLTVGPRWVQVKGAASAERWKAIAKPLSASSVNHRLRALQNWFTVMDPHGPNPVRTVTEASESRSVPRSVSYEVLRTIVDAMPNRARRTKGGRYKQNPGDSLAKARVEFLIWTGMTPIELLRFSLSGIDWQRKQITVPARRKGEGAPGRVIPLKHVPDAWQAVKRLVAVGGIGEKPVTFNKGVLNRAFQRAARRTGHYGLTLYAVRHSFVTHVLRTTKDFRQAQLLAGHVDPRTTERYALAAVLPTLEQGMKAFSQGVKRVKRR